MQAAFLRVKLQYLDKWTEERRKIAKFYLEIIKSENIQLPQIDNNKENVWHIFPIMASDREKLQNRMLENDIQVLNHYPIPVHLQDAYKDLGYKEGDFPIAEKFAKQEISLPLWVGMGQESIDKICRLLNEE